MEPARISRPGLAVETKATTTAWPQSTGRCWHKGAVTRRQRHQASQSRQLLGVSFPQHMAMATTDEHQTSVECQTEDVASFLARISLSVRQALELREQAKHQKEEQKKNQLKKQNYGEGE